MGIPSYFSYIIKNHGKIVRKLRDVGRVQHLYMDCNSIIYDLFHALSGPIDEHALIQQIMGKIRHYIDYIQPTKTVFVAFDGVAPLAKMDQQRTRRHKTLWTTESTNAWSTCNITPGTPFMNKLSDAVKTMASEKIIVSTSEECGEGEHKLFQHIREQSIRADDTAVVYGLDSDLIMLSLFHCDCFRNLYVFRETPEFIKSQIACDPGDPCHFLDIRHLSSAVLREMKTASIYDYVFMCFLLGNDFLPHFPSLNLRTHGIDVLMHTYRKTKVRLIDENKQINWKHVTTFMQALAKQESTLWQQEYETRDKWANRKWSTATPKDRDTVLQNVPIIYRAEEMYIAPSRAGWETRYYKALLPAVTPPAAICQNYVESLAWVFQYYTQGCTHWRFRYKYHYPPLLRDLAKYLQKDPPTAISQTVTRPFPPAVQLAYVIPQSLHATLLEPAMAYTLKDERFAPLFRRPKVPFQWSFCRYFWEAHVMLPDISDAVLEELEWESTPPLQTTPSMNIPI